VSTWDVRVTVGVVVYNGALTLRRAVESILNQTYKGFVIHVSDDGSRDASAKVGTSLAAEHGRVVFTQQPRNLGPANNFRFLLERARAEYFMWLGADDYLEPTYLARMITILDADPTLVACVSRVCFVKPDGSRRLSEAMHPLSADPTTNLAVYLSQPHENGLYALYRTDPLRKAFPRSHFHAFDWAAVAGTLLHGGHAEVADVLMVREDTIADLLHLGYPREQLPRREPGVINIAPSRSTPSVRNYKVRMLSSHERHQACGSCRCRRVPRYRWKFCSSHITTALGGVPVRGSTLASRRDGASRSGVYNSLALFSELSVRLWTLSPVVLG
jgi:glycosyltransferase involved in cell wall biosynthesis